MGAAGFTDNTITPPSGGPALITGDHDPASITELVCRPVERRRAPKAWTIALACSGSLTVVMLAMIVYLLVRGVGVWGLNDPVSWGYAIINFVFWIGIGHAGTLISAILFLFRQRWRNSIHRFAEATTIVAVICAAVFPIIHVGRAWLVYWMVPYPNQMALWPQFRSPLLWDVFAIGTYFVVSLLFWYVGMVPDLATLRDRAATRRRKVICGLLALGWQGSARQWHRFGIAYLLLAALATPLVLSVHSVVSFDFAVAQLPGWHSTILPPYFVVGAIFSGMAMVVTLVVPARRLFGLDDLITARHLDSMNKIVLATSCILAYAYVVEVFAGLYSGNLYDRFIVLMRGLGPFAWTWWFMLLCTVGLPQLFWSARCRRHPVIMLVVCIGVNVGMWLERFVVVVTPLSRDFLPSSWADYLPTWVDVLTLAGSFGLFVTLLLLLLRYLPVVSMAEVRSTLAEERETASPEGRP